MNTIPSRYEQHAKDVYGIDNATIPKVGPEELSVLANSITRQIQPLLLKKAMQRRLDEYRAEKGEQAELVLWDERRGIVKVSTEVIYLSNLSNGVDEKVTPLADRLSKCLGLEGIVDMMPDEGLNIEALRKVLKTAYWLNRNLWVFFILLLIS